MILSFENDLKKSQQKTLNLITDFLELEKFELDTKVHSNSHNKLFNKFRIKRELKNLIGLFKNKKLLIKDPIYLNENEHKKYINDYFKRDIEKLNILTNNKFKYWV